MSDEPRTDPSPLGQALGRVPSGLFILTVRRGSVATGLLTSWVQQAGFEPPMLTVAVRLDRYVGEWIRESGGFVLNQIAAGNKKLIRHFARGFIPEAPAFDGLEIRQDVQGGPVLAEALAYLDSRVIGQIDSGDHCVFLSRIVAGALLDPSSEPMLHVRHSGHHY